jgi:hypothetical protein
LVAKYGDKFSNFREKLVKAGSAEFFAAVQAIDPDEARRVVRESQERRAKVISLSSASEADLAA